MIAGNELVSVLIYLVVWGCILWVLWWGIGRIGLPEPFNKIATVILVLITVVILLNLLMGFTGVPLLPFRH
jgi:heme A synthase